MFCGVMFSSAAVVLGIENDTMPATQPASRPAKQAARIASLEEYYARVYGEPLKLPDRLPKEIAILSLSRIHALSTTMKLMEVFQGAEKDPIVMYLAWEAIHHRVADLTREQRRRWCAGGLKSAAQGGFPGVTAIPLLRALVEHDPVEFENQPALFAEHVLNENSLEVTDQKETLTALRNLITVWHDPSLIRVIAALAVKPELAPRVDYVLRGLPNPPAEETEPPKIAAVWQGWLGTHKPRSATNNELNPYTGRATVFQPPTIITDPDDPRWRAELEIGKLKVTDFDLVWAIDSTGSMAGLNQMVAAQTGVVIRVAGLVSRQARVGTVYARHETDKLVQAACCKRAMTKPGTWYAAKCYPLTTDVRKLVQTMQAERIPGPDSDVEANTHKDTPVLAFIQNAAAENPWSKDKSSLRVIVLVGDKPPTPGTEMLVARYSAECKAAGYMLFGLTNPTTMDSWAKLMKPGDITLISTKVSKKDENVPFEQVLRTVLRRAVDSKYQDRVDPLIDIWIDYAKAMGEADKSRPGYVSPPALEPGGGKKQRKRDKNG